LALFTACLPAPRCRQNVHVGCCAVQRRGSLTQAQSNFRFLFLSSSPTQTSHHGSIVRRFMYLFPPPTYCIPSLPCATCATAPHHRKAHEKRATLCEERGCVDRNRKHRSCPVHSLPSYACPHASGRRVCFEPEHKTPPKGRSCYALRVYMFITQAVGPMKRVATRASGSPVGCVYSNARRRDPSRDSSQCCSPPTISRRILGLLRQVA